MNTPEWIDLMIDIECCGTTPNSALMAIGAAFFDLQSLRVGPTFYKAVHLATSVRLGMDMDPGTVMWWMRQSDQARYAVVNNTYDVRQVLDEFSGFIAEHSRVQDVRPYGNAAAFDLTILGSAYRLADKPQPWMYVNERCFRTIRNLFPAVEYDPTKRETVHHNALDDSMFQIEHLFKIKRSRNG